MARIRQIRQNKSFHLAVRELHGLVCVALDLLDGGEVTRSGAWYGFEDAVPFVAPREQLPELAQLIATWFETEGLASMRGELVYSER